MDEEKREWQIKKPVNSCQNRFRDRLLGDLLWLETRKVLEKDLLKTSVS